MARPLSDLKREAILDAAARLVAEQGTGASTAQIARAARVAEGTLFIYFENKDVLLNAVFEQLETRLSQALEAAYPADGDGHAQLHHLWHALIAWGLARPIDRRALRQLKVSQRIGADTRARCSALFADVLARLQAGLAPHVQAERMPFYLEQVFISLLETTLDAITAEPAQREAYAQAAFELFWRGIQR
ncbi:TetR/AcrR family transcriptional regulator [Bordetella genomosp. 1]|uniref:TetR family transcriptional regulator n=1 Tax=Bordetella genomosp. 1 TaxID=1395607 RepID=A0ABX4EWB2_9BORD|nr:TetR/AcrR family transcriptional regulator [Bordetella genomosp. 1]OZI58754.1 TetR family transcriptional regulator [Bordetella genomosp. 1]